MEELFVFDIERLWSKKSDVKRPEPSDDPVLNRQREFICKSFAFEDIFQSDYYKQNIETAYIHSETRNSFFQTVWQEYGKFEEEREALGREKLAWQPVFEEIYRLSTDAREEIYTATVPLEVAPIAYRLRLYEIQEKRDTDRQMTPEERLYGFRTALDDFNRCMKAYAEDPSFEQALSPAQDASLKILIEWWSSSYYPKIDVEETRERLESWSKIGLPRSPLGVEQRDRFLWPSRSDYHSQLLELFQREFHPMHWEPYESRSLLVELDANRNHAIVHATQMRYAFARLHAKNMKDLDNPEPSSLRDLPSYVSPLRHRTGWGDNILFQDPPVGNPEALKEFELKLEAETRPPMYLWDIRAKRSVLVASLPRCPDYVAISHTWGRFVKRPPEAKTVAGVPWPVKAVTLYDVNDLPEMLQKLDSDYLWLDIFCLPQDESPEHHAEIANQAAIYRRAISCVAWFNEVESWNVTKCVLEYFSMVYLRETFSDFQHPDMRSRDYPYLNALQNSAEGQLELVKSGSVFEPQGWFTSLWTLQEVALCPNLLLCTRQIEVLRDASGTPIDMTTLFRLVDKPAKTLIKVAFPPYCQFEEESWENKPLPTVGNSVPRAIRHMHRLRINTKMGMMLKKLTPMEILVAANLRVAKRARAPAIMSALNILDWYPKWAADEGKLHDTNKEILEARKAELGDKYDEAKERKKLKLKDRVSPLVLGQYPIEFVREMARKIGAPFYSVVTTVMNVRIDAFDGMLGFGDVEAGSMLPFTGHFGADSGMFGAATVISVKRTDHESVVGWHIEIDGTVHIKEAAVLFATNEAPQGEDVKASLSIKGNASDGGMNSLKEGKINLREKLVEAAGKKSVYYAVTLADDIGLQFGIILQTSKVKVPFRKTYLIKVGWFRLHEHIPSVQSRKVDWQVW